MAVFPDCGGWGTVSGRDGINWLRPQRKTYDSLLSARHTRSINGMRTKILLTEHSGELNIRFDSTVGKRACTVRVRRAKNEFSRHATADYCWMFGVEHRFVARQPHFLQYFAQSRIGCRIVPEQLIHCLAYHHPIRLRTKQGFNIQAVHG